MPKLRVSVEWNGKILHADLSNGYCLAIPLNHAHPQPNAFHAPMYEAAPHKAGDWIGDTREGSPVNFFNLRINPHGNGTHTECVGHITKERYSVHETLGDGCWIAQLISVYPTLRPDGDKVIDQLEWEGNVEAIIIRTLPNHPDKMVRQYGSTNPVYLDAAIAGKMADEKILHLLLDPPSVDREEDGGELKAHKAFWKYPAAPRLEATITEMVYIDNMVPDGLYLLQIQIPALELDASPSRPYIYPLR